MTFRLSGIASRLRRIAAFAAAPRRNRWRRPQGAAKDVTVVGYLRAASGVGEAGRQTLRSLLASGLDAEGCDFGLNVSSARDDLSCAGQLVQTSSAPMQIFNLNADQLALALKHLKPRLRPDASRVCIPFWELSRFPAAWLSGLAAMDEIWAPSRFVAQALQCLGKKTVHIPIALEFPVPAPVARANFGLPQARFLFFFAFDFLSFMERKNPLAAIAAFRKAFPGRGQAGLVLKCTNRGGAPAHAAALEQAIAGNSDIFVIEASLTRHDTLALIAAMDAVVSLHRSEGFGLLIGEAMLLGKPVIATDYSASQDLLSCATGYPVNFALVGVAEGQYPHAQGQVWAEPDIDHAAALMRALQREPEQAGAKIAGARAHMQANFSYASVGRLQTARLRALRQ